MILVGMPDSPYVRRVAVSLRLMGIAYEHQQVSVFRHFERFRGINPVVKAPSLVCDDGTVLMDSTLILDHCESLVEPGRRLTPQEVEPRKQALRITGLALAAAEKCVALIYEQQQRPADKRHPAWIERLSGQANAAFAELEKLAPASGWMQGSRVTAADVVTACVCRFAQYYRKETAIDERAYPRLAAHSARAESLPQFVAVPLE
jgi:glutathione S-transferase